MNDEVSFSSFIILNSSFGGDMTIARELIPTHTRPLQFELEYDDTEGLLPFVADTGAEKVERAAHRSKKQQILDLYQAGETDLAQLARRVEARPSYVANVLQAAGLLTGYYDLYTTTASDQNIYSRFVRNVLAFKSVEAARESVARIDRLYNYFERLGDRAGQHQAMIIALTGKNRARWSGKHAEAQIFGEWLAAH
jgi:hypothetical protein